MSDIAILNIHLLVNVLCVIKFCAWIFTDYSSEKVEVLLQMLKKPELQSLCKIFRIQPISLPKQKLIDALLNYGRQPTVFGSSNSSSLLLNRYKMKNHVLYFSWSLIQRNNWVAQLFGVSIPLRFWAQYTVTLTITVPTPPQHALQLRVGNCLVQYTASLNITTYHMHYSPHIHLSHKNREHSNNNTFAEISNETLFLSIEPLFRISSVFAKTTVKTWIEDKQQTR